MARVDAWLLIFVGVVFFGWTVVTEYLGFRRRARRSAAWKEIALLEREWRGVRSVDVPRRVYRDSQGRFAKREDYFGDGA